MVSAEAVDQLATVNAEAVAARIKEEMQKHKAYEPKIEDEVNNFNTRINPATGKPELYWGEEEEE